jgi:hypothetical protein
MGPGIYSTKKQQVILNPHTLARTHTRARILTHAHTHANTRTHKRAHARTHAYKHTHTHTHTHTHLMSNPRESTFFLSLFCRHTYTHAHTHTHIKTQHSDNSKQRLLNSFNHHNCATKSKQHLKQ